MIRRSTAVSPHRVTTAHLQAAYPFVSDGGLGGQGVYIGREAFGGTFCYDPWVLYRRGVVTNPNVVVAGQVGRGKSSLLKTYLWRQQVFGRRAWIVDPKGEYGPLAEACGVDPIRVGPGSPVRLNPLEAGPGADRLDHDEVTRRRVSLLASLAASSLGRELGPEEMSALDLAIRTVATYQDEEAPTVPEVVEALLWPDEDGAARLATDPEALAAASRPMALELRRLCQGDLSGMFDAPTTAGLDLEAPVVVLDLSAVHGTDALGLLMICATAWLQASLTRHVEHRRIVVVDEAWAILRDVAIARWLQAAFKLSRQYGVSNVAVVHRLSDLTGAGAAGSEQARLAKGLLADSETQIVYGQSDAEVDRCRELLGLTDAEAEVLPRLGRGVALWRVAGRSFVVEHRLGRSELELVDTDQRMR